MNISSVSATRPSVEFSTGTSPKSDCLRWTSSNTAAMLPTGTNSTLWPKRWMAARWLKLYSGPRKTIRGSRTKARQPLCNLPQHGPQTALGQRPVAAGRQPFERFLVQRRSERELRGRRTRCRRIEHQLGTLLDQADQLVIELRNLRQRGGLDRFRRLSILISPCQHRHVVGRHISRELISSRRDNRRSTHSPGAC